MTEGSQPRYATALPSLFISHGAPDMVLSEGEAVVALRTLAARLQRPRAIIIISAHWRATPIGITDSEALPTVHDFDGFPEVLYALRYPAKGDAALSADIERRLRQQGLNAQCDPRRGLDHGAWMPLMVMYPAADIPVVQVSLPATEMGGIDGIAEMTALVHLGNALAPLRKRGHLVIGSGGSTHNLAAIQAHGPTAGWALQFEQWLRETVEENHFERLLTPSDSSTVFKHAHPSLEHYAPLIVAWAAGNQRLPGRRVHHGFDYGNLGMSFFEFD